MVLEQPRSMRRGWSLSSLLLVASLACSSAALAGDRDDAAALANKGYDQMQQGDFAAAAALFYQADERYHSPVFLVFAAEAEEKQGQLLKAKALLERVRDEPLERGASDAFRKAKEDAAARLRQLESRIPRATLDVLDGGAGVTLELDGDVLSPTQWGVPVPLDPGPHEAHANTVDGRSASRSFRLDAGQSKDVFLRFGDPATVLPDASGRSYLPAGIAFGVAGAGAVAWAVTGALFVGDADALKAKCEAYGDDAQLCPPDSADERASVETLGNVSTAMAVVTGVAAAAGVVLLVVPIGGGEDDGSEAKLRPRLQLSPTGVGFATAF